jgi:putative hydrolase of the HAD superfamily
MPALRAVFFDLDDTLFDHTYATSQSLKVLLAGEPVLGGWKFADLQRKNDEILNDLHPHVLAGALPLDEARESRFRQLIAAVSPADVAAAHAVRLARKHRAEYERHWQAVPGAIALCAALRTRGLGVGIVTNNLTEEQQMKLARTGLAPHVDALITSADVGAMKPDVRIFQVALDRFSVSAREAVMVGDSWPVDILGAQAAGIRAVWFNRHERTRLDPRVTEIRALEPVEEIVEKILD